MGLQRSYLRSWRMRRSCSTQLGKLDAQAGAGGFALDDGLAGLDFEALEGELGIGQLPEALVAQVVVGLPGGAGAAYCKAVAASVRRAPRRLSK